MMGVTIACALALLTAAAAAPFNQHHREKRASYGGGGNYGPACGSPIPAIAQAPAYPLSLGYGAPLAHGGGYGAGHAQGGGYGAGHAQGGGYGAGPAQGTYGLSLGPAHGYGAPAPHGYGLPQYRSDSGETDMMAFPPEMEAFMPEDSPMARYAYAPAAAQVAPAQAYSGDGAMGIFPNAKVGGCAVPLLLSCSPSVVTGRILHSQPAAYSNGAGSGAAGAALAMHPTASPYLYSAGAGAAGLAVPAHSTASPYRGVDEPAHAHEHEEHAAREQEAQTHLEEHPQEHQ